MSYLENLGLFSLLLFGIIIVPGMDMLYVLASSLSGGRRSGYAATAGMMTGGAVHTVYGTLATGMLVAFAPRFFTPLLILATAYMAWIGLGLVRSAITVERVEGADRRSYFKTFRQAVATCLLNPKAYIFVIAVYPQFLTPLYGPIWRQGLVMGALTLLVQAGVYGSVAWAGDRARKVLIASPALTVWIGRVAGLLLITVAALTLWQNLR
ncbi:MAG: LysE family translocator [Allorhizobium sp.]